jgi:hypothetical protein
MKTHALTIKIRAKKPKNVRNRESAVRAFPAKVCGASESSRFELLPCPQE